MTKEEYTQKIEELRRQEIEIATKRKALQEEYKKSLNKPYEHLLFKKVCVTYKPWGWLSNDIDDKTVVCYWGGYRLDFGEHKARFYQIKKDGSMSQRELHLMPKEIISMVEVTE